MAEETLPCLRRFAIAALGDRSFADYCVEQTLHKVLGEFSDLKFASQRACRLYLFGTLAEVLPQEQHDLDTTFAWRSHLLVHIEQFDRLETAQILKRSLPDVKSDLLRAERLILDNVAGSARAASSVFAQDDLFDPPF